MDGAKSNSIFLSVFVELTKVHINFSRNAFINTEFINVIFINIVAKYFN